MHNSYFVKSFCWCIISKGSTSLSKYYFIAKIKQEKAIDLLMRKEVFLSKSEHMILLARSLFSHFFKEICIEVSYNKIMLKYILWTNSCFDGSLSLLNMKCLSASWASHRYDTYIFAKNIADASTKTHHFQQSIKQFMPVLGT